jgi:hypothetical protein
MAGEPTSSQFSQSLQKSYTHLHFHGMSSEDIATALGHLPGDRQS